MAPNSSDISNRNHEKPNIKGDRLNFVVLTFLYLLQGVIGGIVIAISIVLQKRNATYEDQAEFNFVWYPSAFKVFWAPIVDSIYVQRVGRRKSWLITSQYFIGALLLLISINVDDWLGSEDGKRKPNVRLLTVTFSLCQLFSSVQEIAADGWSLTIFQKKNITYSAVCQNVGIIIGASICTTGFIILASKEFCNMFRSVPQDNGFISSADFIFFWAMTFILTPTLILLFKKETEDDEFTRVVKDERDVGIRRTYSLLWKILEIRPMQMLCIILLLQHLAFGPILSVASLKLLDNGVSQDVMVLSKIPLLPIQLLSPFVLNRFITGHRPLRIFLFLYVLRLANDIIYALFVFIMSDWMEKYKVLPTWYYWPLILIPSVDSFGFFVMTMAMAATFARISDARFGGVYMTLLNCINNVGYTWPTSVCLWLVNWMTIRSCNEDQCRTIIDGFYVEVILFTLIGILWIWWAKKQIYNLENTNASEFIVKRSQRIVEEIILDERILPLVVNQHSNASHDKV